MNDKVPTRRTDLHFWIGEWEVYLSDTEELIGHNGPSRTGGVGAAARHSR